MALLIFETKKAEEENKYDFCFSLKKKIAYLLFFVWVIFSHLVINGGMD